MSILAELQAIEVHLIKWAQLEYNKTTKSVIMSLLTKRRKLVEGK